MEEKVFLKPQTPVVEQAMIFFRYSGCQETSVQMSKRFGLSHAVIHEFLLRILGILVSRFSDREIKRPRLHNKEGEKLL